MKTMRFVAVQSVRAETPAGTSVRTTAKSMSAKAFVPGSTVHSNARSPPSAKPGSSTRAGVTCTPARPFAVRTHAPTALPTLATEPLSVTGEPTVGISSRVRNMPNAATGRGALRRWKFVTCARPLVPRSRRDDEATHRPTRGVGSPRTPSTASVIARPLHPPTTR